MLNSKFKTITLATVLIASIVVGCGKKKNDTDLAQGQLGGGGFGGTPGIPGPTGPSVGAAYNRNGYRIPILNPNNPAGPLAYDTGRYFQRGQQITVSGITGGWGAVRDSGRSYLGGLFRIYDWTIRCDEVNNRGRKNGRIINYQGAPAGLYASDGVQAYLVGGPSGVTWTANADGTVLLGYNTANNPDFCYTVNGSLNILIQ